MGLIRWGLAPRLVLAVVIVCLMLGRQYLQSRVSLPILQPASRTAPTFRPIESIQVGQRVIAENPELTGAERAAIVEPDFSSWMRIRLELPLASVSEPMQVELLRPEWWLRENIQYALQPSAPLLTDTSWSPPFNLHALCVREIYREELLVQQLAHEMGQNVGARYLELNLSDMGAVGLAQVLAIEPCLEIESGTGSVVTGRFSNLALERVLEVRLGDQSQSSTIGVTASHPFWSPEHEAFVPIDQLPVGATVLDYQGCEKRILSKLPRPGPQDPAGQLGEPVFNLEVHGEHVYCVGQSGILVHNRCGLGDTGEKAAKEWLKRHGYTDIHQFQNPSGHGIDIVARHRDGTLTFFEVKTSSSDRMPALSKAQQNQNKFITSRLQKAATGGPYWSRTPQAVRDRANSIFNELASGANYRRYVISITNAGNASAPTIFRFLRW